MSKKKKPPKIQKDKDDKTNHTGQLQHYKIKWTWKKYGRNILDTIGCLIPFNYSSSDISQAYTCLNREWTGVMKMFTATLETTRMILCRRGHIFCLTTESATIIKSSFGCNSSNKHFMSPLIQHPIQSTEQLWAVHFDGIKRWDLPLVFRELFMIIMLRNIDCLLWNSNNKFKIIQ